MIPLITAFAGQCMLSKQKEDKEERAVRMDLMRQQLYGDGGCTSGVTQGDTLRKDIERILLALAELREAVKRLEQK